MSADIFISYKSEEEASARRIRQVLEDNGFSCWMAPDSIPAGSNYMKQIPQAIDRCKAMIILVSEKSQQSTWVKNEFSQAVTKDKLIIPYVIQDCELNDDFRFSMGTMQQVYAWKNEEEALRKVIKDLRDLLGAEGGGEIKITVEHRNKIPRAFLALAAALLVLAGAGAAYFLKKPADSESSPVTQEEPAAEVYYSEVIPYLFAGSYNSAEALQTLQNNSSLYQRAVSLVSFIKNPGDSVFAEKIACGISDLVPITDPDIHLDGILEDGHFRLIAYNNGWGDAENVHYTWRFIPGDGVPEFPELIETLSGETEGTVKSGEAETVFDITDNMDRLLQWAIQENCPNYRTLYTMYAESLCNDVTNGWGMMILYDAENQKLFGAYGGAGDPVPQITLYAVLNVDNPPEELRFYTGSDTPLIEDQYKIETVIIPTKSCSFTVNGSYSLGGTLYETEPYDITVKVPYFDTTKYVAGGPLTRELFNIPADDKTSMRRICYKYRYDILSILPPDAPAG